MPANPIVLDPATLDAAIAVLQSLKPNPRPSRLMGWELTGPIIEIVKDRWPAEVVLRPKDIIDEIKARYPLLYRNPGWPSPREIADNLRRFQDQLFDQGLRAEDLHKSGFTGPGKAGRLWRFRWVGEPPAPSETSSPAAT